MIIARIAVCLGRVTRRLRFLAFPAALVGLGFASAPTSAQTNNYVSAGSGWWETATSWSLGVPPNTNQTVQITNAGSKTIRLYSTGPGPYSTVSNLVLSAGAPGQTNTLEVDTFQAPNRLTVLQDLTINPGGVFYINNSTGQVNHTLSIWGQATVNHGTLNAVASVKVAGLGLAVTNGAQVTTGVMDIEGCPVSVGGGASLKTANATTLGNYLMNSILWVTDPGTQYQSHGLTVGAGGTYAFFCLSNAAVALLLDTGLTLGDHNYNEYNQVLVCQGALLDAGQLPIQIGPSSGYNGLSIASGGHVQSGDVSVSGAASFVGYNSATVTGAGSAWTNTLLQIGPNNYDNWFLIDQGGVVANANGVFVGVGPIGWRDSLTVNGNGSLLTTASTLQVGDQGNGNQLLVSSNATVLVGGTLRLSSGAGSTNNTVILSGGNLTASNTVVGDRGAGQMTISNGITSLGTLTVGNQSGAQGTLSILGGTNVAAQMAVGASGSGAFTIGGGMCQVLGNLAVANTPGATGQIAVAGGQLIATNGSTLLGVGGAAALLIAGGQASFADVSVGALDSAVVSDGTLTVASLTTTPTASFTQNGGVFNGVITNHGTFIYNGGLFNGLLVNDGTVIFNTNFNAGLGFISLGGLTITNGPTVGAGNLGVDNEGALSLAGGTLNGTGPIVNNNWLSGYGALAGTGGLVNNASFTQTGGNLDLLNAGPNANNGTLFLAAPYELHLSGGALANNGLLNLNGTTVSGGATLLNTAAGAINGPGFITAPLVNAGLIEVPTGQLRLAQPFLNTGAIDLNGALAMLSGGAISNKGTIQGNGIIGNVVFNTGPLTALGGTLKLNSVVSNQAGGLILAATGNKILALAGVPANDSVLHLEGGTFDNNNHTLTNNGEVSGAGIFTAGAWRNNGTMTFAGGTAALNGPLVNLAGQYITVFHTPATFTGNVTNYGVFKSTGATVAFAGAYVENGVFTSDPATNSFTELVIGPAGCLQGGAGDQFIITGNLLNGSTASAAWNTTAARLTFAGGTSHRCQLAGADRGAAAAGYNQNFAWGTLELAAGQSLVLQAAGGAPARALYVTALTLAGGIGQISSLTGNGMNIYYDAQNGANAWLGGKSYALLAGGHLLPVTTLQITITSIARNAAGNVVLRFTSDTNHTYQVWSSGDLVNWTNVPGAGFTLPTPGLSQWIDDGSLTGGLPGHRFYRIAGE